MGLPLIEFAFMLVVDLLFLVALFLLMLPLGIWRQAAFAVMKRNFIGYFSNPCLLYTSPSPRDGLLSRMPSSA